MSERTSGSPRAPQSSGRAGRPQDLGPMPAWNLADLYPEPQLQGRASATSRRPPRRRGASSSAIRASSPRWPATGAALAEAIAAYESLSDTIGRLGSYAGLLYAADTSDPREREVLRRHPGEDHGHHDGPDLLRAGAQQDRRGRCSRARCRCRRSRATSRGSTTCARRSPISSTSSSSACSTRSRSPRTAPGAGSSARP